MCSLLNGVIQFNTVNSTITVIVILNIKYLSDELYCVVAEKFFIRSTG